MKITSPGSLNHCIMGPGESLLQQWGTPWSGAQGLLKAIPAGQAQHSMGKLSSLPPCTNLPPCTAPSRHVERGFSLHFSFLG